MNRSEVRLPFGEHKIEQLKNGHPITDAADFLQKTIISNTASDKLNGLELGSGNGIISLMLALQKPEWVLTGIDIQKELILLAEQNAHTVNADCNFLIGDLREYKTQLGFHAYQLVYSNPPWVKHGAGLISPDESRAISRQEITCTMMDILAAIEWCLHPDGTGWVIYPVQRKKELAREMLLTRLELVNIIQPDEDSKYFIAKLKHKSSAKKWF